jgi:hypothetical protein
VTRDDIIRLAREAGFIRVVAIEEGGAVTTTVTPIEELERFIALYEGRLVERGWRQCAEGQTTTQYCGLLELAVTAEREACAELCESITWSAEGQFFAKAIRARGEQ